MGGIENDVLFGTNVNFTGADRTGQMNQPGQLLIGASSYPYLRSGFPTGTQGIQINLSDGAIGIQLDDNTHETAVHGWVGAFIEQDYYTVTSDGATITLSLEQEGGGDLTMVFTDDFYTLDCTPAATVTLTAGSDTAPQVNYVYVPASTKILTASTTSFPTTEEYIEVAKVLCQSAASLQTYDPYADQNRSLDVTDGYDMGHIHFLDAWIRTQNATWKSGVTPSLTIVPNGGTPDNVYLDTTSGVVLQLYEATFHAFTTPHDYYVINDSVTPYKRITDLNECTSDSGGNSFLNKYFALVIWGSVTKDNNYCKIWVNLPSGSYNNSASLIADSSNYSNYSIPTEFKGTGFLICKLNLNYSAAAGGTWTEISVIDLRGYFPGQTAGGGAVATNEFPDNLFKVYDEADNTKILMFQCSSITTGNTRVLTVPDADGTIARLEDFAAPPVIGNTTPNSATFTTVTADTYYTSNTTTGLTLSANSLVADGSDLNIDIDITPKGTGEVNLPKVDIDSGAVDAITLGTNSPVLEAQIDNVNINGSTITYSANPLTFIPTADAVQSTIFQALGGGTPVFQIDTTNKRIGINTSAPDESLEVNATAGGTVKLSYNFPAGSATTYAKLQVNAAGDLDITPSSGVIETIGSNIKIYDAGAASHSIYTSGFTGAFSVLHSDDAGVLNLGSGTTAAAYNAIQIAAGSSTDTINFILSNATVASLVGSTNRFGIGTTGPDLKVEINDASGNCLRLTYNDADGSALNYADFTVSSAGDLTIAPSGGDSTVTGSLKVSGLNVANGIVQTDGTGLLSSSTDLPNGTTATTQAASDNSTKVATTAYVDSAIGIENLWDRVTGPPNYLTPHTAGDELGATGLPVAKGWFTNVDVASSTTTGSLTVDAAAGTIGFTGATSSTISTNNTILTLDPGSSYVDVKDTLFISQDGSNYLFIQKSGVQYTLATTIATGGASIAFNPTVTDLTGSIFFIFGQGASTVGSGAAVFYVNDGGSNINAQIGMQSLDTYFCQFNGSMGVGTTGPGKKLDVNSATGDCLRLTYNDSNGAATTYADLTVSAAGKLTIAPSGSTVIMGNVDIGGGEIDAITLGTNSPVTNAQIDNININTTTLTYSANPFIIQGTVDSTTGVQILDADGGTPIINIDTTNERLGIGTSAPVATIHAAASSSNLTWGYDSGSNTGILNLYPDTGSSNTSSQLKLTARHGTGHYDSFTLTSALNTKLTLDASGSETPQFYMLPTTNGLVGINTSGPAKALEINSATGAALRLTYNDSNGSAAFYNDFTVGSAGDLTVDMAGTQFTLTGGIDLGLNIKTTAADAGNEMRINFKDSASNLVGRIYHDLDDDTMHVDVSTEFVVDIPMRCTAQFLTIQGTTPTLTIGDGGAEDTKLVFDGNAIDYHIGLDDTTDQLDFGTGLSVGTNVIQSFTTAGEINQPLQPAFLAYNSVTDLNVTGTGTVYTVEFNQEIFDQNSDFNNTTDTFTAPVTGRYFFTACVCVAGLSAASSSIVLTLVTSNRSYQLVYINAGASDYAGQLSVNGSTYADMDSADTAYVTVAVTGEAGDVVDIRGNATPLETWFSGALHY